MEGDVDRRDGGLSAVEEVDTGEVDLPRELRCLAFHPYVRPEVDRGKRSSGLQVIVRKPLLSRLTKDIVETYQICDPKFKYSEVFNPKRFLTTPHNGVLNDGFDNANSDLILSVNLTLVNEVAQRRYIVKKKLGKGTFGQVVECWIPETNSYVAVKVIKNQPAYFHQARHEVHILTLLNQMFDPEDKHHIIRMLECFVYQRHLCISFEKLGINLFELLELNRLKGLSLTLIRMFSKQMLQALMVLKDAGIIHCDLKPENVLLCSSENPPKVKIIDFGSACLEGRTVYSYIQSRHYRSPEVVLGYPYTTTIDMWSFGCIVAELFLGFPLFPGLSDYDLLRRMIIILDGQPPDNVLRNATNTSKFFKLDGSDRHLDSHGGACAYRLLTKEEYEAREEKLPIGSEKWYFNATKLDDIVNGYPVKKNLSEDELIKERIGRLALIDFLRGLVEFDPEKRWTPLQASGHPFITGEPFAGPYNPPAMASSHMPVSHQMTVDYGAGRGYWGAAGLSPHVSNTSRGHFAMMPSADRSSFGSYNETSGNRGSYGSYGDANHVSGYYSPRGQSGLNVPVHLGGSTLGTSPNARTVPRFSYGGGFGRSPTKTLEPMSVGHSPSQFTPPGSQTKFSPGKYGPTSPARGSIPGSPLGKSAALSNKKRNKCPPGSTSVHFAGDASQHLHGQFAGDPYQQLHSHHIDGAVSSYPEVNPRCYLGRSINSSHQSRWNKQRGNDVSLGSCAHMIQHLPPCAGNSAEVLLKSSEPSSDQAESSSSIPQPGDWDPNYSDELLLQEGADISPIISGLNSTHLGPSMAASAAPTIGHGLNQLHPNSFSVALNSSYGANVLPDASNSTPSLRVHGQPGQDHLISMPTNRYHFSQSSTSHFRQPPFQLGHVRSMFDERNYRPNYGMLDPYSSANIPFGSRIPWGHHAGRPFIPILPSPDSKG